MSPLDALLCKIASSSSLGRADDARGFGRNILADTDRHNRRGVTRLDDARACN
jgi:hypothetical protein